MQYLCRHPERSEDPDAARAASISRVFLATFQPPSWDKNKFEKSEKI
jgi:hypothetical protein